MPPWNGQRLFYRHAGPARAPAVVLLHGFPASSFMFRHLIPLLADRGPAGPDRSTSTMYVQDYSAPVGWRLALANPEAVTAIITQNGNGTGLELTLDHRLHNPLGQHRASNPPSPRQLQAVGPRVVGQLTPQSQELHRYN